MCDGYVVCDLSGVSCIAGGYNCDVVCDRGLCSVGTFTLFELLSWLFLQYQEEFERLIDSSRNYSLNFYKDKASLNL